MNSEGKPKGKMWVSELLVRKCANLHLFLLLNWKKDHKCTGVYVFLILRLSKVRGFYEVCNDTMNYFRESTFKYCLDSCSGRARFGNGVQT